MNFHIKVVKPTAAGELVDVEGSDASYWVRSNTLFSLLDRIEENKRGRGPQPSLFPWYQRSFDYESGRKPQAADCFRPKEVLASVQGIERELQKHPSKYPSDWTFWVPQPDGSRQAVRGVNVQYRGKPCRLFGDERGSWAVETDTPVAFPLHYELTESTDVRVQLQVGGPEVTIAIERTSPLTVHGEMLQGLTRICLVALQDQALVLTTIR